MRCVAEPFELTVGDRCLSDRKGSSWWNAAMCGAGTELCGSAQQSRSALHELL
jgi:hypothetical protein